MSEDDEAMRRIWTPRWRGTTCGVVVVGALALALVVGPTPAVHAAHGQIGARLYQGVCDNLTESFDDLTSLGFGHPVLTPAAATPEGPFRSTGAPDSYPAVTSTSVVDTSLDQLLAEPHAIQLSLAPPEDGDPIPLACGNVGGVPAGPDLVFGLANVVVRPGATTTTGIAWLHANPDDTTTVQLFAAQGLADTGAAATPTTSESSP